MLGYIFSHPYNHKFIQDGPSLESSSYLNVTLRYLGPLEPGTIGPLEPGTMGPWDALTFQSWTLGLLDFRTLGPFPSSTTSTTSLHFLLHPLSSFYLFLLLLPTSSYPTFSYLVLPTPKINSGSFSCLLNFILMLKS